MRLTILAVLLCAILLAACTSARTPDSIIADFKTAGLEAEAPTAMPPEEYGLAPYVGKGVHFFVPSICPDCGGRVFVGTKDEIAALQHYYEALPKASAILFSWVFVTADGKALVQINGDLSEEQARKYEDALNK